ncbi:MAG TPA: phage protein Gp37 [Caulobacteraceae bacterium]|nr:phage protein Gp37 [Caulobacteraceae bacterium]
MIGAVENGMIKRVVDASMAKVLGYTYATTDSWPKEFDDYLSSQTIKYPALWSVFGGVRSTERVTKGRWRSHATFGLVAAAENKRNERSRRFGGTESEVGTYQMAQDIVALLGDQTLGLDIDALAPVSIEPVETSDIPKLKQISMLAVTFATALYFETEQMPTDAFPFKTIHANWDPAPYGHVDADPVKPGVQIPDDAHAIATDIVNLPQGDS